jgi:N-ethylmaleimide reductase
MRKFYEQRTSEGSLIIGEATNISLTSRGWLGAPGLYSDSQIAGWKKITSAVKAKGGHKFAQLWHTGRSSHIAMTGGVMPVSASVNETYSLNISHLVSIPGSWSQPSPHRALTVSEIARIVQDYKRAAERAELTPQSAQRLTPNSGQSDSSDDAEPSPRTCDCCRCSVVSRR